MNRLLPHSITNYLLFNSPPIPFNLSITKILPFMQTSYHPTTYFNSLIDRSTVLFTKFSMFIAHLIGCLPIYCSFWQNLTDTPHSDIDFLTHLLPFIIDSLTDPSPVLSTRSLVQNICSRLVYRSTAHYY